MAKEREVDVVMIRAKVESSSPERTQFKPYGTVLTFDGPGVYIDIPVPAEHVRKEKDGSLTLSLEGWTIFLDVYASAVEKMNERWTQSKLNPTKNYHPY